MSNSTTKTTTTIRIIIKSLRTIQKKEKTLKNVHSLSLSLSLRYTFILLLLFCFTRVNSINGSNDGKKMKNRKKNFVKI